MFGFSVFESFNIINMPIEIISSIFSNSAFLYILQCILIISLFLFVGIQMLMSSFVCEPLISNILKNFYLFIYNVIKQQLVTMKDLMVPHMFTIATLILCGNICGLLPYGFSITAFPGVTLVLSSIAFFSCVFLSFFIPIYTIRDSKDIYKVKYLHILSFFAPHDVPTWLYPLIILIEVISFFFRLVSLGFRLAANLMAGHILIGLLASAYCGLIVSLGSSILLVLLFTVIVGGLLLFELFVAFLQTYVFIVLLCSYYNDIYSHFDARS